MKHFIVEITYRVPTEQLSEIRPIHRQFLHGGYQRGLLLCSGPLPSLTGGMVVARAESLSEIETFFVDDPYQRGALADYRFIEFEPVLRQGFMEEWVKGEAIR